MTDTIDKNSWVAASDDSSWFAPRLKTLTISPDAAKELPPHLQLRHVHVRVGHDLYQVDTKGHPFAQSFLSRPHGCQEVIGKWLSCKLTPDNHARWIQLAIANMFPSRSLLHKWGKESSPKCTHCNTVETYGHIQSRCMLLEKPPTKQLHGWGQRIPLDPHRTQRSPGLPQAPFLCPRISRSGRPTRCHETDL